MNRSHLLFERATSLLPGGVNSPVRAFRAVGGKPVFIDHATGCRLFDVDGNEYIDYIGAWGSMITGHAHPHVVQRVVDALNRSTHFGTPSPPEVELAEEIRRRMPAMERIRMVNSGTEAVMSAVRLARAATGRSKIVKFDGAYHGHADSLLVRAGSGVTTLSLPDSPGVPIGATGDTLSLPYNDFETVDQTFSRWGKEIAAVIIEPVAGNMGVVPPENGFLPRLRTITINYGSLLIFDEVMTGFRVHGGGAQALYGVTPDLTTLGKIIGGGLPVGAYGGRADLMALIAPDGPVYQAGTMSGNPVTMTAGLATLALLDERAYQQLEQRSQYLAEGISAAAESTGVELVVQRVGSMLTVFFRREPVNNLADARAADHSRFAGFFHALLRRGVHLPPSGFEAWFVSLAHDDEAINQTLGAIKEALAEPAT